METVRDNDGFVVPPTPPSQKPSGSQASSHSVSGLPSDTFCSTNTLPGKNLVTNSSYMRMNLRSNHILLRPLHEQFPEHIAHLVDLVARDRNSPGPSLDQVKHDAGLNKLLMSSTESDVARYFQNNIFYEPDPLDSLQRADKLPMAKHLVPGVGSLLKVSIPVPDMIYGYTREAFSEQQEVQLYSMGYEMVANSLGLIYPFFVIEFKADNPSGTGSLWVATNQCLGGSATCINISERLNDRLKQRNNNQVQQNDQVQQIDSIAFSIAMTGTEARLYISWKNNEIDYYTQNFKSFLLHDPEHYLNFRKYVLNIIDWGKGRRLETIRKSLDKLLEDSRKKA